MVRRILRSRLFAAVALFAAAFGCTTVLGACNTVKGFGQDVTSVAQGTEDLINGN